MSIFQKIFKTFIPFAIILLGVLLFAVIGHFFLEEENPEPIHIIKQK